MATGTAGSTAFQLPWSVPHVSYVDITYTSTSEVNIIKVPANSTIVRVYAHVTTAFNDSGTDTINVQQSGQSAGQLGAMAGGTAGVILGTALATATSAVARPTSDTTITVKYAGQNSDASAGAARVFVEHVPA